MPIVGSGFFSVGALLLFNSVLNYLPDAYPEYAASVLAGNDLFRSSFGAGFPLFASAMYNKLGVAWASSLLGFLAIAFIPIPFVLYKVSLHIQFIINVTWLIHLLVRGEDPQAFQECSKGLLSLVLLRD